MNTYRQDFFGEGGHMGQLIKVQDYISRYEINLYHYPSQFIRLKKMQWTKLKEAWNLGMFSELYGSAVEDVPEWEWEDDQKNVFSTFKDWFQRRKIEDIIEVNEEEISDKEKDKDKDKDADEQGFTMSFTTEPKTEADLKLLFLEEIFRLQLEWASSTIRERSRIDKRLYHDGILKYFVQRFPDTFLCMYKPVFILKNAMTEMEVILLTPMATWCIVFTESHENNIIIGSSERFWEEKLMGGGERKLISPMIGLKRTENIVRTIFQTHGVDLPIKKLILNRNGYIDYRYSPHGIEIIDKRTHEEWFRGQRNLSSPLKHMQLKGAQALMHYCDTQCVANIEWKDSVVDFEE